MTSPAIQLGGDLDVIRSIGEGATARVYLAREPALRRLVAVKVLRDEFAADPIARQRFEREAQSAARISHPHVTHVHRVGRSDAGAPFIVMEYIEGRTLADVEEARGELDAAEGIQVLLAVASALAAAHEQGIVHRDVRPGNVFLENRTGRAVLGDFGIAALLETGSEVVTRLTAVGVRLGDVRYMSPEQLLGEPVTEQSDVYAFGILAYEVLTGGGPYDAHTDAAVVAAHLEGRPRSLADRRPDLEPRLTTLLEHCLARDPNRRPRAAELVEALAPPRGTRAAGGSGAAGAPGVAGEAVPEPEGPLTTFLNELRRRRVYQVLVAYGAVGATLLGGAQAVYEAFDLPDLAYRTLVGVVLVGFPVAMVLSWIYDISAGGVRRTRPAEASGSSRVRVLTWIALALSVTLAMVVGWLLLSRG